MPNKESTKTIEQSALSVPREVRIQVVSRNDWSVVEVGQEDIEKENEGEVDEVYLEEEAAVSDELVQEKEALKLPDEDEGGNTPVPRVPFYSQFADISSPSWQKVGCGIASVSMLIDFYSDGAVSVDDMLARGIKAGAYIESAGWSHAGLIALAAPYGLNGESVSLSHLTLGEAMTELTTVVSEGPVMASVHYTFEPTNPIPHLVVITGVRDGKVFYNDPAEPTGNGSISIDKFKKAWKKRYISIRPT